MPKFSVTVCYDCSSGTTIDEHSIEMAVQRVNGDTDLLAIPSVDEVDLGDPYKVIITNIDDPKEVREIDL